MLVSRCQAEGKGDHDTDHEGGDDNGRIIIFVYFHADSPIILFDNYSNPKGLLGERYTNYEETIQTTGTNFHFYFTISYPCGTKVAKKHEEKLFFSSL